MGGTLLHAEGEDIVSTSRENLEQCFSARGLQRVGLKNPKGVFANQLKTVFSEVMDYDMVSEKGIAIDAVFGAKSVNDRIVMSPFIIGTTNVLLELIGKKAVDIYFK